MISHLYVKTYPVDDTPPVVVRAFAHVEHTKGVRDYVPMAVALSDKAMRAQVLAQAREEIRRWTRIYGHLTEFAAIVRIVNTL